MSQLRVRYHSVLIVLSSFLLVQGLQAQGGQGAGSTPTSNGQDLPANAQSSVSVTDPFSVVNSKGTWTNQSGIPTVHGYPLPFGFSDLLDYGYDNFLPNFPWKPFGGTIIGAAGYVFDARSLGCEYAGEPGSCVTVVSPDGHVLYPGDNGAPTICPQCPPYQEPGSAPILLNVPTRSDSPGPVNSGVLNSTNGIVINIDLVSDSPAPENGITFETQMFQNPSNDGTEVQVASVPISFQTSLVADAPSPVFVGGQSTYVSNLDSSSGGLPAESAKTGFWDTFFNVVQITLPIVQSLRPPAAKVKDPCGIIGPGTIVYNVGCTDSSGKPVKVKK